MKKIITITVGAYILLILYLSHCFSHGSGSTALIGSLTAIAIPCCAGFFLGKQSKPVEVPVDLEPIVTITIGLILFSIVGWLSTVDMAHQEKAHELVSSQEINAAIKECPGVKEELIQISTQSSDPIQSWYLDEALQRCNREANKNQMNAEKRKALDKQLRAINAGGEK